jgi:hypothetical protein
MKGRLLISILILSCFSAFSQTSDTTNSTKAEIGHDINHTTIYTNVDSPAVFPGGRSAWINYVQNTLNPAVGIENGAKKGTYNVVIRFTVTKDGTLKDFVPVTKYKRGFEDEVIRVLKLSPKWIPAKKNGVNVNSITEQLQVFVIL